MHELSIAVSLVEVALEEARRQRARCVVALHVRLGPLAGVVAEALTGAFELARADSPWPGMELVIEEVPILARCPTCVADRPVRSLQELACAECGTPTPDLVQGRELELRALEIES